MSTSTRTEAPLAPLEETEGVALVATGIATAPDGPGRGLEASRLATTGHAPWEAMGDDELIATLVGQAEALDLARNRLLTQNSSLVTIVWLYLFAGNLLILVYCLYRVIAPFFVTS